MSKTQDRRSLAILGPATGACLLALDRVLRSKERDQALFVLDYRGAASALLSKENCGNLHVQPLSWCDLANRRKPVAVFRMGRSSGFAPALKALIRRLSELSPAALSEDGIEHAVKFAWQLADHGTVRLASLLEALRRPEISGWFRRCAPDDARHLTGLLEHFLRFPSVWAASEGNNTVDLGKILRQGGTAWLEMPSQHLERIELAALSSLAEAAVMDTLLSAAQSGGTPESTRKPPLVLYVLPTLPPISFDPDTVPARHIGVFGVSAQQALPKAARAWAAAGADCWVTGGAGRFSAAHAANWLSDTELLQLSTLQPGQLWARSGVNRSALVMRVRAQEYMPALGQFHRQHALKRLRFSPESQFSSSVEASDLATAPDNDLFAELHRRENLLGGWLRVRTHHRQSCGSDDVTIAQFESQSDRELERLAEELRSGKYRCRPLKAVRLAKTGGGERVLKIPCVRDRVVQAACLALLEPLFEPRFSPFSFAYRQFRNAHHALACARTGIGAGMTWAVIADIQGCFDAIDHDILLRLVGDVVIDPEIIRLLRHWLTADALDFGGLHPSQLGVPQGAALSPLLANIYLDPMDREFERAKTTFVRYADDYLVLCETREAADAALRLMADFLQSALRLALKPAKTQCAPVAGGIEFLGFLLDASTVRVQPRKLAQAVEAVQRDVETVASARSTFSARASAARHMNALIRGFRQYFLFDRSSALVAQLHAADAEIERAGAAILPLSTRHDIAWLARERLVAPELAGETDGTDTALRISGQYPAHPGADEIPDPGSSAQETGELPSASSTARHPEPATTPNEEDVADDKGYALVDGRLYVMRAGVFLTVQRDALVMRRKRQDLHRIPLDKLEIVVLQGPGLGISAELVIQLGERDVPVVFAPAFGRPAAIASLRSDRSHVRQQQILRRDDPRVLATGAAMLAAKVGNQASVLKYFARHRRKLGQADLYELLSARAAEIRAMGDRIRTQDITASGVRNVVMGHEGRAAALYWSALGGLIPEALAFPGRRTREAADAFNQAINYVYGMLYGEVWKAVSRAGLDPCAGIMHGTDRDQGSLVFDLIEELRAPFGDRLVLGMLGRGFEPHVGVGGRLRSSVRRLLVDAFHRMWKKPVRWRGRLIAPRKILDEQATSLRQMFLSENDYRPFQFRW